MPKIYFDERWPVGTGIGVVSNEIRTRLTNEIDFEPLAAEGKHAGVTSPWKLLKKLNERNISRQEIFWNPGFVPPASLVAKTVIQVHDLIHLHYYSKSHRIYYNLVYKPLYRKMDRIITGSEYSRAELCEWAGLPLDRVDVVYHGVSDKFGPAGKKSPFGYDYIFYPGNYRPYKNLDRLLRAFATSSLPSGGVHLVMTGVGNDELFKLASSLNITEFLHFSGRLSFDDLAAYYRSSQLICFPSLYEGFGLPILEGMASGVPVLTSNVSSMPEVAGGAAYLINPESVEEMQYALEKCVFDTELRRNLISLGFVRVGDFSWNTAAKKMLRIFKEVLST